MSGTSMLRPHQDIDPFKVSSPRIFLVRMLVFLALGALLIVVLYKQILNAFNANPFLNGLIIAVLLIGIWLAFRQVTRLFPEIAWVNSFRLADPGLAVERPPVLLAPMAAILGDRVGRMAISSPTMQSLLNSVGTRLDEARDMSRYMTGLLVFLGLLGTFWGLIETVGSVGNVIKGLKVGGDTSAIVRRSQRRSRSAVERHGNFVLLLAVRIGRIADTRIPRPPEQPGAKPLLHRS